MGFPEKRDEIQMMKSHPMWPRWPFLPVKNKKRMPRGGWLLGVLAMLETGPDTKVEPVVYDWVLYSDDRFDKAKVLARYSTVEEMVEDGWVVD